MKKIILGSVILLSMIACSKIKLVMQKGGETDLSHVQTGAKLAEVNGTGIYEGHLDILARINPRVKSQLSNPASRKKILDNIIEQELLYQESLKRGLDTKPEVLEKATLYKRVIISQALLEEEMEKQARSYYEENKDKQFTKVNFSQIQVNFNQPETSEPAGEAHANTNAKAPTAEEKNAALKKAQAIKARLDAGEDFAKVAEEASDDKVSKRKGGDMGAISREDKRLSRLGLDALADKAFSLKQGDLSEIIESSKGYHIIKVTSDMIVSPFEEAEKVIRFQVQQDVKDKLLAALKESAKVTYLEKPDQEKKEVVSEDIPTDATQSGGAVLPPTPSAPTPMAVPPQGAPSEPTVPVNPGPQAQIPPSTTP